MSFKNDTLENIYNSLRELEDLIESTGLEIKQLATDAAKKQAKYEKLKNDYLILMLAEERDSKGTIKRTDAVRQAMYRSKYSEQRLDWQLAERGYKAECEYLRALLGNQISVEVRKNLIQPK